MSSTGVQRESSVLPRNAKQHTRGSRVHRQAGRSAPLDIDCSGHDARSSLARPAAGQPLRQRQGLCRDLTTTPARLVRADPLPVGRHSKSAHPRASVLAGHHTPPVVTARSTRPPEPFAEKLTAFAKAPAQRVVIWPVVNELHQLGAYVHWILHWLAHARWAMAAARCAFLGGRATQVAVSALDCPLWTICCSAVIAPDLPVLRLRTCCRPWPCDRLSRPRTTTTAPPRPDAIN